MYIEMELLSDAMPDSGLISTGIADAEIPYDECGIPYIPAKRIKGILRENAEQLAAIGILTNDDVANIFGNRGEGINYNFTISDGNIDNIETTKKTLKYFENNKDKDGINIFNKNNIIDSYSYLRVQTKIEEETGVAKDKSLRTFRVLNKGLKFKFDITIDDKYKEQLEKILKITRNFGSNRTRGMGEIKLILEEENAENKINFNNIQNGNRISMTLKTESQLIVATKTGCADESNDFISGKFILGELAYRYIKKHNLKKDAHTNENFKRLFLSGETIFENGYPVIEGNKFYPSPLSIVKEKDNAKQYYDLLNKEDIKKIEKKDIMTKGGLKAFSHIKDDGKTYEKNTPKSIEFHHQRPDDKAYGSPFKKKENSKENTGAFYSCFLQEKNAQSCKEKYTILQEKVHKKCVFFY